MSAWQQGLSGSQVVKHGRESPTAATAAITEDLSLSASDVIAELATLAATAADKGSGGTVAALLQKLHGLAQKELGPQQVIRLKECLALAAKALKQSLEESAQLKETIQALEVKVVGLQKFVLELKQQQEESRQSVLLGQLVYGLDDLVRIQVMGPNFPPTSLADIQAYVDDGFVSAEGQRKWGKFVDLLEEQDLSVQKVVTASKPLRRQRFEVAHGTTEERASVSTAQIREWAAARDLQPMVEIILKVLSPLTRDGQPLIPRNNLNDLFA